jgi:hypothetical protein
MKHELLELALEIATKAHNHDLEDNMDIRRLGEVTEKDLPRLNKYLRAYKYLTEEH